MKAFWTDLRVKLASGLVTCAAMLLPGYSQRVLKRYGESILGMQHQIDHMGRTGGVMMIGWHTDEKGKRLARKMEDAAMSAARIVRHNEGSY